MLTILFRHIGRSFLVVLIILVCSCSKKPTPPDPVVTFPDPNLEAAIRERLKKHDGDILASELSAISSLTADSRRIFSISGLEYCTGLRELHLYKNDISDIRPLTFLVRLERLYLSQNDIVNIAPLAGMTGLETLELQFNQITDISPLTLLTDLTILILHHNEISDISPLVTNSENGGLGGGDGVWLGDNPLSEQSKNKHIPTLQARGVTVHY